MTWLLYDIAREAPTDEAEERSPLGCSGSRRGYRGSRKPKDTAVRQTKAWMTTPGKLNSEGASA